MAGIWLRICSHAATFAMSFLRHALRPFMLLVFAALLGACDGSRTAPPKEHALVGGWAATDGTLFHFRADGTFHGVSCAQKELWGNWVTLSDTRIGFQSLMHDSFYRPQYAIISENSRDQMDYIVTGGTHFIHANRVTPEKVVAAIELAVEPKVHRPSASP